MRLWGSGRVGGVGIGISYILWSPQPSVVGGSGVVGVLGVVGC